jgi:transposase
VSQRWHSDVDVLDSSKEFLEAGKRRLADDMTRAATADEVTDRRREAQALQEVVADLIVEKPTAQKKHDRR